MSLYEFGGNGSDGFELEELVSEGYELLEVFNWSDHFPLLGWLDLQGMRKSCTSLVAKVNTFVRKFIKKHSMKMVLGEYVTGENKGDFDGGGSAGDEKDV